MRTVRGGPGRGVSTRGGRHPADTDRGSLGAQDDCFAGILDEEMPRHRFLGYELEGSVFQILVCYAAVIQENDIRVRGTGFPRQGEGQRGEPQHAEAPGVGAARNARKRPVDPGAIVVCRLAGSRLKLPNDWKWRTGKSAVGLQHRNVVIGKCKRKCRATASRGFYIVHMICLKKLSSKKFVCYCLSYCSK